MAKENATPGTTFTGPLQVVAPQGDSFATVPASVTVAEVGDTSAADESGDINDNFAALTAAVNALLERLA